MKFTEAQPSQTRCVRYISIEDGPVHGLEYSATGRRFRVETVTVEYTLTPAGTWEVRSAWDIRVTGTVLKNDGSDSKNGHSRRPETDRTSYGQPPRFEGEWQWAGDLIEAARPTGTITLP